MVVADNTSKEIYFYVCDKLKMALPETLTMGVVDKEGKLYAGVVYYLDKTGICYLSVYADSPYWALPANLSEILKIAFNLLKGKIAKFEVSHKNARIIKLLKGLGAVQEGLLRYKRQDGTHEIVFSFTEREFKRQRWHR